MSEIVADIPHAIKALYDAMQTNVRIAVAHARGEDQLTKGGTTT